MTTALPPPDVRNLGFRPFADRLAFQDFECGESEIDRKIGLCCEWQTMHRARMFCARLDSVPFAYAFYCIGIWAQDPKGMDADIQSAGEGRRFVPFIYLHYLAVRKEFQGNKIGTMMLGNFLDRCASVIANVGMFGVALNALTPRAAKLYHKYGFRQRNETKYPLMILPSQSLLDPTGLPHRTD